MTFFRSFWLTALGLLAAIHTTLQAAEADPAPGAIKVMTYNLRYGTAKDGENHWDKRKDFLAATIQAVNPDLLGTQETLGFQRDFVAAALPGHEVLAVGREDGKEKGEMTAIYWRRERFAKLAGGHFWLSEKPDEAGSMGWDTSLPRMATWVRLQDKVQGEKPILWINTHFDHRGKVARVEAAKLIRQKLTELGPECSWLVTGDFNSAEGSEAYQALFGARDGEAAPVVDSYRAAHPTPMELECTTTPFVSAPRAGARIDWIGLSRDWKVQTVTIEHPDREGRTASDHFPVVGVLGR